MIVNSSSVKPLLKQMGDVGIRLSEIGATEGAAGNISICVRDTLEVREFFPQMDTIDLPTPAPELAGAPSLSRLSRRLQDIADAPCPSRDYR
jgi:rhamnulose-1-phosphate aldolase